MDAAKAAISKFTSNKGHKTSVEESVQPSITQETVKPHRHEEATQAVDREVHQDHYHTTVQPLSHQEVLPEKHTHNVVPTEHREFHHGNEQGKQQSLAADLAHFKDSSRTEQTRHTTSAAPAVTGEHVHHHVHETVVPVIQKETIQPEVVHTTVPIHETHHAAPQHHGLSALPTKNLDEFTKSGARLTGGSHESHEEYGGPPRQYNDKLSTTFEKLGLSNAGAGAGAGTATTSGIKSHHQPTDSGVSGVGGHGHHGVGTGVPGAGAGAATGAAANRHRRSSYSSYSSSSEESVGGTRRKKDNHWRKAGGTGGLTGSGTATGQAAKPSLIDRLNPRKDADGDGKAGIGD